jgi:tRNA 2-thiouridine synthesizing protein E
MSKFTHKGRSYEVDDRGFLLDYHEWDGGFAEGMAPSAKVHDGLTEQHWRVIRFIRNEFEQAGECPLVFSTCRGTGLSPSELKSLFPAGYTRGACRLAGLAYRDRFTDYYGEAAIPRGRRKAKAPAPQPDKIYRVNAFGFLVDASEWDEDFASNKAREMKMPGGLSERHNEVIQFLRRSHAMGQIVPSLSDCCDALGIDPDEFERLFPDGYVRGALKIAGLCVE